MYRRLLPFRGLESERTEPRSETNPEELILRIYVGYLRGRNLRASQGGIPVGTSELDKQVLDPLHGAQAGVADRRDIVEDIVALKASPLTATIQDS